ATVPPDGRTFSFTVNAPKAKPWSLSDPRLYVATASFMSADGKIADESERTFGFRWFDIGEKDGDKRFYLNGKRVFVFAAMSRGFWAKNGIFPTRETAEHDIATARALGYNTVKFHRSIGQPAVMDVCDETGHLAMEEPGGYRCMPGPDDRAKAWRREKLRRMALRDRSRACIVLYNLKNESDTPPDDDDIANMRLLHSLDPVRIITYNSDRNRTIPYTERLGRDPFKLHLKPLDDTLYYHGWWDQHHWIPYVGYLDEYYENPRFYLRGVVNGPRAVAAEDSLHRLEADEIIFWGEEGAGGTMVSLGRIKNELDRTGATGWREGEHLDFYRGYDRFLDESGFRKSYPTVDHLTRALGANLHYFHGRALENVRISNIGDAYVLNGWASGGTHSDIVDAYRYPTADPSILSYYSRPLYIAVKLRDKVMPAGFQPVADLFIVNEADVKGKHTLAVELIDSRGGSLFSGEYPVQVGGGETFGQLLVENVQLPPLHEAGYFRFKAELRKGKTVVAEGADDIFVVDYRSGAKLRGTAAVIDTGGTVEAFLNDLGGMPCTAFDPAGPRTGFIILGAHDFDAVQKRFRNPNLRATNPFLDRAANGATLVILDQADRWAEFLDNIALRYVNTHHWVRNGRLFVGESRYLEGLPQSTAMNWECQAFYRGDIWGLGLGSSGVETIVAAAAQHRGEILNALCRVPYGNGEIILSTLRLLPELASGEPQSATAKKLFVNLLSARAKR
ncbi:MAG: glycoside hydrolase family 2 TIM barrel-domain containing protein, partial [Candidatus Latescibacterota bacterium]